VFSSGAQVTKGSGRKLVAATLLSLALAAAPAYAHSSPVWVRLAHPARFNTGAMLLLTDGQVLVQDQGPNNSGASSWWLLTPSTSGSYRHGTWKQAASLPSGYGPISFASAVLPDGRVLIEGGEDNLGDNSAYSNRGAIYNPITNRWTPVRPPQNGTGEWSRIGDAPAAVLANGEFMIGASGYSGTTVQAIFDEKTLTWTPTGTGKADGNDEEGWSLLPDGDLLTVDTADVPNSELYDPTTGSWRSAGPLPASIVDPTGEVGPELLMPDGVVFAAGGNGKNALYVTTTGDWLSGPPFPVIGGKQYDIADGPAAVLPDGNVLLEASPGDYHPPARYFVSNGGSLQQVTAAPDSVQEASSYGYMLVLPTGEILANSRYSGLYLYEAGGRPKQDWRPAISSVSARLAAGKTYTLRGRQLNGLTQGAAYGDDFQDATNYPLVSITNDARGTVTYARTFGFSNMSIAPHNSSSTRFTVPRSVRDGNSKLVVVTNGITSRAVNVKIRGGRS
jgi:Kelch motif